jgi:hypothetical protein
MGQRRINHRDRHGRGLRRPLPTKLFSHGIARSGFFEQVVIDTCEYLTQSFPEELSELSWRIEDVPLIREGEGVRRYQSNKGSMSIVLYRIPIERFGKHKMPDPRMEIEHAVVSAAAELIDKDPWELIHPEH